MANFWVGHRLISSSINGTILKSREDRLDILITNVPLHSTSILIRFLKKSLTADHIPRLRQNCMPAVQIPAVILSQVLLIQCVLYGCKLVTSLLILVIDYISSIFALFPYICIYSPIGAKIEKSSEKDFNVRISCRTKAQSIPEGLGHKMALGAKLKKKITKFFFTMPNLSSTNFTQFFRYVSK